MATVCVTTCDECGETIATWQAGIELTFVVRQEGEKDKVIGPELCCFDCLRAWLARYENTGLAKGLKDKEGNAIYRP